MRSSGFTMIELVVVLAILAALAGLVVSTVDRAVESAEDSGIHTNLSTIRDVIMGSATSPGYFSDMRYYSPNFPPVPSKIADLFVLPKDALNNSAPLFDRNSGKGWRGPYLRNHGGVKNVTNTSNTNFPAAGDRRFSGDLTFAARGFYPDSPTPAYGVAGEPAIADPWGNPIVIQQVDSEYSRVVSAGPDGVLQCNPVTAYPPNDAVNRGDDIVIFLRRADVAP